MKEQFDYKLIDKFPGYNSASDKTNLPAGTMIRGSKNIYKTTRGTLSTRPGLKRRGSVDSTEAGVKAEYVWNTNVGTTRPLRVCNGKLEVESTIVDGETPVWYELFGDIKSGSILTIELNSGGSGYSANDIGTIIPLASGNGSIVITNVTAGVISSISIGDRGEGYSVSSAVTFDGYTGSINILSVASSDEGSLASSLTRFIFDSLWDNDEKIDELIFVRGDEFVFNWFGGIVKVASTTGSTITKLGDETWGESGFYAGLNGGADGQKKIYIDGVMYRYTGGVGTTTLTGVTPDPSSITADSVVIQSVIVNNVPDVEAYRYDFVKIINNQAWYGSYSSRIIYISADTNAGGVLGFLNLVDLTTHVYGDADSIILDNQAKGIGVQDGFVIIFAGENDMYVVTPNQNVTYTYTGTDGLARFNFQKIQKKQLNGLSATLGHEFIDNMNGSLVWVDQKNQLRAQGSFANIDAIIPTTLSLAVESELSEDDFTGGHLKVIGSIAYITAPNNARDWMYEVRERIDETGQIISERLWHPPQIRGISRFSVIDGILYGHSNANPQIYQIWDTDQWFDDDPSEEEIPYIPVIRLAYQNHGRRQGQITFDSIYLEGYMAEGFDLRGSVFFDYRGFGGIRDISVSNDTNLARFFTGLDAPTLGDSSPGDNPFGDGILEEAGLQELVPKFRTMINVPQSKDCFEYALGFYSLVPDCRWEILVFGTNVRQTSANAVFLKK